MVPPVSHAGADGGGDRQRLHREAQGHEAERRRSHELRRTLPRAGHSHAVTVQERAGGGAALGVIAVCESSKACRTMCATRLLCFLYDALALNTEYTEGAQKKVHCEGTAWKRLLVIFVARKSIRRCMPCRTGCIFAMSFSPLWSAIAVDWDS